MDCEEKDAAAVGAAKAGLKKMDQRHLQFAQRDRFDFQLCGCRGFFADLGLDHECSSP